MKDAYLEQSFYLMHSDKPNAAYNAVGLACRLCFQFGLHQQPRGGPELNQYDTHIRQRVLWTVYFTDRRISLSCGRPYGMCDVDIDIDEPAWIDDRVRTQRLGIQTASKHFVGTILRSTITAPELRAIFQYVPFLHDHFCQIRGRGVGSVIFSKIAEDVQQGRNSGSS